jgi:transposase InsO family protein
MRYSITEKQNLIQRYHAGESATNICLQTGVARSTLYAWLKAQQPPNPESNLPVKRADYNKLESKVRRLEQFIEVLKKVDCTAGSPTKEKLIELEKLRGDYSVHLLCDALDVPRGTFYNHILRNKRENKSYQFRRTQLSEQIKQVYDDSNQIFGAKKIKAVLSERGIIVGEQMVSELMREMNIASIRIDAKKNHKRLGYRTKKDELKLNFKATAPNKIWASDTTYFRLDNKNHYICAILDLYSRKVVSYKTSLRHSTQLATSTFKMAYADRKPEAGLTFHSDRGVQFTSHAMQNLLRICNATQSFSPSGSPQHNAVMESFFSSLKQEELFRKNYRSIKEFKDNLSKYMDFYNNERPHQTLHYKTPNAYERLFFEQDPSEKIGHRGFES